MSNAYFYAQIDANNVVICVSQLSGEVIDPHMISITSYDQTLLGKTHNADGTFTATPATLSGAQSAKLTQLATARDTAIFSTFQSSALGSVKTYSYTNSSATDAFQNFRGKAIELSINPNITTINWATKEDGFVAHTRAQFIQVVADGGTHQETNEMKYYTKEAQVNAATTIAAVNTIGWPINPNPPSVPVGLAGTAGTGQAVLSWTANSDVTMLGGGGYNVYVDGVATAKNTSLVTGTTFTVTGLTAGAHTFSITAVDTDGNESAKCAAVSVTVT